MGLLLSLDEDEFMLVKIKIYLTWQPLIMISELLAKEGAVYSIFNVSIAKHGFKGEIMHDIIPKLKTPEECMQLEKNVRDRNPDLAREARRKAVELRAIEHGKRNGVESAVEMEILKVLYAYEEVLTEKNKRRTRAARTWQMIKRHGILEAAERAVNKKIEPMGYKVLVEMGMHDLTFESVIVRYPGTITQRKMPLDTWLFNEIYQRISLNLSFTITCDY